MHGQHLRPPRSAYCAPWANDNDDVAHRKLDAAVPSHRAPSLARGYSHVGDGRRDALSDGDGEEAAAARGCDDAATGGEGLQRRQPPVRIHF